MRDHLGGGFHRYSVDGFWHVPHFEKMLYDQAQLAVSFTEAWQLTREEFFAEVARETLEYVLRDMRHPDGGLFSAEDADSLLAHGRPEHAKAHSSGQGTRSGMFGSGGSSHLLPPLRSRGSRQRASGDPRRIQGEEHPLRTTRRCHNCEDSRFVSGSGFQLPRGEPCQALQSTRPASTTPFGRQDPHGLERADDFGALQSWCRCEPLRGGCLEGCEFSQK